MSRIRAGGHVLTEHGWRPADLVEEEVEVEPVEEEEEPEQAEEGDDLSEFSLGGGWYQIGDEKVHGKDAAREALEG